MPSKWGLATPSPIIIIIMHNVFIKQEVMSSVICCIVGNFGEVFNLIGNLANFYETVKFKTRQY